MKSVAYIVLQSYAYYNKLVVKYFCTTTNFWRTYIHAYSDLSNFEQVQSLVIFIAFIPKTLTKGQILGTMFVILSMILEFLNWINGIEKRLTDLTVSLNRIQTSSYNLKTQECLFQESFDSHRESLSNFQIYSPKVNMFDNQKL